MFQSFPVNITGPSYQSRSRPLASQETRNFYQEVNEGGKESYTLMPFPGLVSVGSAGQRDRGMHIMSGEIFRVIDNALYVFQSNAHRFIGFVPGTERCIFADDGTNLFFCSNKKVFWYNGVSVTEVSDPDIIGVISVDILNNQIIYTSENYTGVAEVGDGSSVNGLDIIGAEANPDKLVRDYVFQERLLRFGERTTERWYNSGVGQPPIARLEGQIVEIGLAAKHSVSHNKESFFFLGTDRHIYQGNSAAVNDVTSGGIINLLESFDRVDDAVGYCFSVQNQNFYLITFPTAKKTFVVNDKLGTNGWFELSYGMNGEGFNCESLVFLNGVNYLADTSNGHLYKLDVNTYDFNGTPIKRRRVTGSVNGSLFGPQHKAKRLQMSAMDFVIETGTGLMQGNENPRMQIETSLDGGKSWRHETWLEIGRLGQTNKRVRWNSMKSFHDMIVRITFTEPCPIFIYAATIDLRLAGR